MYKYEELSYYLFYHHLLEELLLFKLLPLGDLNMPFAALGRSLDIFDSGRDTLLPDFGLFEVCDDFEPSLDGLLSAEGE